MQKKQSSIKNCRIIDLPKEDAPYEPSITRISNSSQIPFDIERVYYTYDITAGSKRGGHAHKELQQLIIAASGSFDVVLKDSKSKRVINLNRPHTGLYIPKMIWRELKNFSGGGVCLVLASLPYDENDYFRDYDEFKKYCLLN